LLLYRQVKSIEFAAKGGGDLHAAPLSVIFWLDIRASLYSAISYQTSLLTWTSC